MPTGRLQALMIAHGGLVLLLGMLCGLPFAFHLLGRIELWPIPWAIDLTIPGTERGWRRARRQHPERDDAARRRGGVSPADAHPGPAPRARGRPDRHGLGTPFSTSRPRGSRR